MQGEHGDLLVIEPIRGDLTTLAIEDKAIHTIPSLDHVQSSVDLPSQVFIMQIATQKDGLDGAPSFGEGAIRRMLDIVPREASQDRFGVRRPQA